MTIPLFNFINFIIDHVEDIIGDEIEDNDKNSNDKVDDVNEENPIED